MPDLNSTRCRIRGMQHSQEACLVCQQSDERTLNPAFLPCSCPRKAPKRLTQNIRKGVGFQPVAWPIQRVHRAAPLVPSARLATTDLLAKCIASSAISKGKEFHALHSNEAGTRQFPRYAQGNRRALLTCVNNAQTWLAVPIEPFSPIFLAKWRFQPPSSNHACAAHNP